MAIPLLAATTIAGAGLGMMRSQREQRDAARRAQMYAQLARVSPWSGIAPPNAGVVGAPASMMEGAVGGGLTGLQMGAMFKKMGLDAKTPAKGPYGSTEGFTSRSYSNPYENEEFVGPPTPNQFYRNAYSPYSMVR